MRQSRLVADPALQAALLALADRLPIERAAEHVGLTSRTFRRFLRSGLADKSWRIYVIGRLRISFPNLIDSAFADPTHTEANHEPQNKIGY